MGAGASVDGLNIVDTERSEGEAKLLEVLHDKTLLGKFFKEVAIAHSPNKKPGNDFNINQTNVLDFYNHNSKSEFHKIFKIMEDKKTDLVVLIESFKFSKPNKKGYIVPMQWAKFLRSIYHIGMLYKAFHAVDSFICDGRIFLNEFKTLKESLAGLEGMKLEINATDEEILEEFNTMDTNKDQNISFAELCAYANSKIHQPELENEITAEDDAAAEQEALAAQAEEGAVVEGEGAVEAKTEGETPAGDAPAPAAAPEEPAVVVAVVEDKKEEAPAAAVTAVEVPA